MTEKTDSLGEIVAEAVSRALAQAVASLAISAPSRSEFEALRNEIESRSLSAALAALGSNGRLAANGGNLVIDYDESLGGGGSDFEVRGEKAKYKVVALREWTDESTMTDVGSEGSDEDLLYPTYDYVRFPE